MPWIRTVPSDRITRYGARGWSSMVPAIMACSERYRPPARLMASPRMRAVGRRKTLAPTARRSPATSPSRMSEASRTRTDRGTVSCLAMSVSRVTRRKSPAASSASIRRSNAGMPSPSRTTTSAGGSGPASETAAASRTGNDGARAGIGTSGGFQEIREDLSPALAGDGLRMELHAPDRVLPVPEGLDLSHVLGLVRPREDLELRRKRRCVHDERVIARDLDPGLEPPEDRLARVDDPRDLAVHGLPRPDDPTAVCDADGLMAEANAEERDGRTE